MKNDVTHRLNSAGRLAHRQTVTFTISLWLVPVGRTTFLASSFTQLFAAVRISFSSSSRFSLRQGEKNCSNVHNHTRGMSCLPYSGSTPSYYYTTITSFVCYRQITTTVAGGMFSSLRLGPHAPTTSMAGPSLLVVTKKKKKKKS